MPPKRKAVVATLKATPAKRRSKLAKDNDISDEQLIEIKDAWAMHADDEVDGFEKEKEGVVATGKIRVIMRALNIEPRSIKDMNEFIEILDPESDGYVTFAHFVELAAIQINSKTDETKQEEVEKAYKLFTKGVDRSITFVDLKRIAALLNQDVSEDVLRAMICDANESSDINAGVDLDQFKAVMTRAGVFS